MDGEQGGTQPAGGSLKRPALSTMGEFFFGGQRRTPKAPLPGTPSEKKKSDISLDATLAPEDLAEVIDTSLPGMPVPAVQDEKSDPAAKPLPPVRTVSEVPTNPALAAMAEKLSPIKPGAPGLTEQAMFPPQQQFDDVVGLDRLRVFHLNDSAKDFGSHRDRHAHIGQGKIGVDAFQFLLRDERLAGRSGILETPKDDDVTEDLMNLTTLRGLT